MCQNEMNLKAVLADLNSEIDVVNSEREYSKQYLELLNITKEQYDEALEKRDFIPCFPLFGRVEKMGCIE